MKDYERTRKLELDEIKDACDEHTSSKTKLYVSVYLQWVGKPTWKTTDFG